MSNFFKISFRLFQLPPLRPLLDLQVVLTPELWASDQLDQFLNFFCASALIRRSRGSNWAEVDRGWRYRHWRALLGFFSIPAPALSPDLLSLFLLFLLVPRFLSFSVLNSFLNPTKKEYFFTNEWPLSLFSLLIMESYTVASRRLQTLWIFSYWYYFSSISDIFFMALFQYSVNDQRPWLLINYMASHISYSHHYMTSLYWTNSKIHVVKNFAAWKKSIRRETHLILDEPPFQCMPWTKRDES